MSIGIRQIVCCVMNNNSFIDAIGNLIYRWSKSPGALNLYSIEYAPSVPFSSRYSDTITLKYLITTTLDHAGLKEVARTMSGLEPSDFKFEPPTNRYHYEIMTISFHE